MSLNLVFNIQSLFGASLYNIMQDTLLKTFSLSKFIPSLYLEDVLLSHSYLALMGDFICS